MSEGEFFSLKYYKHIWGKYTKLFKINNQAAACKPYWKLKSIKANERTSKL